MEKEVSQKEIIDRLIRGFFLFRSLSHELPAPDPDNDLEPITPLAIGILFYLKDLSEGYEESSKLFHSLVGGLLSTIRDFSSDEEVLKDFDSIYYFLTKEF